MNIATKNTITNQKLYAIVKGKEDIIFLNDIRLNDNGKSTGVHDFKKNSFYTGINVSSTPKRQTEVWEF